MISRLRRQLVGGNRRRVVDIAIAAAQRVEIALGYNRGAAIGPDLADIQPVVAVRIARLQRKRHIGIADSNIGKPDIAGIGDGHCVVDGIACRQAGIAVIVIEHRRLGNFHRRVDVERHIAVGTAVRGLVA